MSESSGEEINVLVVDDEPLVRAMTVRALKRSGIECREAGSVAEAAIALTSSEAAVVITDMQMPDADGLEMLSTAQQLCPDAQVLMLTGQGSLQTAVTALTRGAFAYLSKPVDPEALLCQVRKAIQHRRLLSERENYLRELEDAVRQRTAELEQSHEEMSLRLVNACCFRDTETGAHIKRVGLLSAELATALGWPQFMIDRIRSAAPLHDIGKTAIPDAVLRKPGGLTDDEFTLMKTHTTVGAEILTRASSPVLRMAHDIALAHHERWNGSGYPFGLRGRDIPESARIVAVADVFDAVTHDRVYRKAFPRDEVVHLLTQGRGTDFEPAILDVFLSRLPRMYQIMEENPDELAAAEMVSDVKALLADHCGIPAGAISR